jgi:hypothetical protein
MSAARVLCCEGAAKRRVRQQEQDPSRHPPTQADFDNGNGSCQGRTSLDGDLLMKVAEPAAFQATIQVFAGMFWR